MKELINTLFIHGGGHEKQAILFLILVGLPLSIFLAFKEYQTSHDGFFVACAFFVTECLWLLLCGLVALMIWLAK